MRSRFPRAASRPSQRNQAQELASCSSPTWTHRARSDAEPEVSYGIEKKPPMQPMLSPRRGTCRCRRAPGLARSVARTHCMAFQSHCPPTISDQLPFFDSRGSYNAPDAKTCSTKLAGFPEDHQRVGHRHEFASSRSARRLSFTAGTRRSSVPPACTPYDDPRTLK